MPSTYTLNNGIELIGTGEQSGTWGDTTNTNFELIDTALDGQVTVTLASAGTSGSPNTLPISDGSSSNGRNRMVIFNDGADLGATAYVQLTPNDAEKIVYIRNALSGSRSIIVFQGTYSASNDYEIPAGTTAVIYFNGGGAGAVAANVFNNAYFDSLRLGSVSVTAIIDDDTMATAAATNIPTAESVKAYVDAQVGANNELSEVLANGNTTGGTSISVNSTDNILFGDNNKAIFGAGSDLQIYHDGSNSYISELGSGELILLSNGSTINLQATPGAEYMARFYQNAQVELYYDNAVKIATTATGVDVTGTVTADGLTVDGNSTLSATDAATNTVTTALKIGHNTSGTTANGFGSALEFEAENSTYSQVNTHAKIESVVTDQIAVHSDLNVYTKYNNTLQKRMSFNNDGDISFYEDTGTTPKFFWDASAEALGIGTSLPASKLHLDGFSGTVDGTKGIRLSNTVGTVALFEVGGSNDSYVGTSSASNFSIRTNNTARMTVVGATGNVGIGTSSPDAKLVVSSAGDTVIKVAPSSAGTARLNLVGTGGGAGAITSIENGLFLTTNDTGPVVVSTNNTEAMRIDSSGRVGIGTSSPARPLDVNGTLRLGDGSAVEWGGVSASISGTSTSNALLFSTASTERMRIDSSGNLGLGVVPSAWTSFTAMQFGETGCLASNAFSSSNTQTFFGNNLHYDGAYKYIATGSAAAQYLQLGSEHRWNIAPSGTAGNTITFSQAMTLAASGGLSVGTTSDAGAKNILLDAGGKLAGNAPSGGTSSTIELYNSSTGDMNLTTGFSSAAITFATQSTERMRIDSSGNVGIGTSSPSASGTTLNVKGTFSTSSVVSESLDGTGFISMYSGGGGSDLPSIIYPNAGLRFGSGAKNTTGYAERMRIDSSGNLLVGGTSTVDSSKLYVVGGISQSGNQFNARPGSGVQYELVNRNGAGFDFYVNNASNLAARIDSSGYMLIGSTGSFGTTGNQGIRPGSAGQLILGADSGGLYHQVPGNTYYLVSTTGGNTSDATLKKNVATLEDALSKVCRLRGVSYEFIDEPMSDPDKGVQIGVIAQEVEAEYSEAVVTSPDGIKSVRYEKLIAPLIEAIKDQQAIIEALEARITALEA